MKKIFVTFIGFLLSISLYAQDVFASGEALYHSTFSLTNDVMMHSTIDAKYGKGSVDKYKIKKTFSAKDLKFQRNEALSKIIQKDFVTELQKTDPVTAKQITQAMKNNQLRKEFDLLTAANGFSSTNLADALAAYWIVNWQIIHDTPYSDRRGFNSVRKMAEEVLLKSPSLKKMRDSEKQFLAETYGYHTIIAYNTIQNLKRKNAANEVLKFRKVATEAMRNSGIDMERMTLTTKGFESL